MKKNTWKIEKTMWAKEYFVFFGKICFGGYSKEELKDLYHLIGEELGEEPLLIPEQQIMKAMHGIQVEEIKGRKRRIEEENQRIIYGTFKQTGVAKTTKKPSEEITRI